MKKRLPRKLKKKIKNHIAMIEKRKDVIRKCISDEMLYGFSAVHVDLKSGEMSNVPINEAIKIIANV